MYTSTAKPVYSGLLGMQKTICPNYRSVHISEVHLYVMEPQLTFLIKEVSLLKRCPY